MLLTSVYNSIALTTGMTLAKGASQPNNAIRSRIAVVYHEQEFVNFLAEVIRGEGYEVDVFTNTLLALEKIGLQHSTYSLVLAGWRNPRITGVELALELHKIDPGIEIILFSSWDFANQALDQIARTDNVRFDHLSQPFEMSVLLEAINNKIKNGKSNESDITQPFDMTEILEAINNRIKNRESNESDITHRRRLPPGSKKGYRKTNDNDWKMKLIQIGAPIAITYIMVKILQALGFFSW